MFLLLRLCLLFYVVYHTSPSTLLRKVECFSDNVSCQRCNWCLETSQSCCQLAFVLARTRFVVGNRRRRLKVFKLDYFPSNLLISHFVSERFKIFIRFFRDRVPAGVCLHQPKDYRVIIHAVDYLCVVFTQVITKRDPLRKNHYVGKSEEEEESLIRESKIWWKRIKW